MPDTERDARIALRPCQQAERNCRQRLLCRADLGQAGGSLGRRQGRTVAMIIKAGMAKRFRRSGGTL